MPADLTRNAGVARQLPVKVPDLIPLTVLGLCVALRSGLELNHDAAWLMVAAGRLLAGGHYATEFFEVNMPQAIALYVPAQLLHADLGLKPSLALELWTLILVMQCLVLIRAVGARSDRVPVRRVASPMWLGWLALGLIVLPGNDFGQREHLATILALPFVFMLAADTPSLSPSLRCYITLLAAIGLYTKPHYALLPWLLLFVSAPFEPWRSRIRSPEVMTLAAVALAEALVLVLRFPGWFICARWADDLYGAYRQPSFWYQLDDSSVIASVVALALLALAVARDHAALRSLWPFLASVLYSMVIYLLQGKGWPYQFLPAMLWVFAALPLCWMPVASTSSLAVPNRARMLVIPAMLALLAQAAIALRDAPRAADLPHSLIGTTLSAARKGDAVYVFSTSVTAAFPAVVDLDLRWSSRYSALWPLAGIAEALQSPDPRSRLKLARYAQPLTNAVAADFQRYHPSIVIVDHRPHQFGLPPRFDILGFFEHDPAFLQIWNHYDLIGSSSDYDIYRDHSRSQEALPPGWASPL